MLRTKTFCLIAMLLMSYASLVQNKMAVIDSDHEGRDFANDNPRLEMDDKRAVFGLLAKSKKNLRLKDRDSSQSELEEKTKRYVMALDNMKYIENHLDDQKPRRNRSKFHVLRDYKDVSAADLLKLLRDAGK